MSVFQGSRNQRVIMMSVTSQWRRGRQHHNFHPQSFFPLSNWRRSKIDLVSPHFVSPQRGRLLVKIVSVDFQLIKNSSNFYSKL